MINQFILIVILAFIIINFLCTNEKLDETKLNKSEQTKKKVRFNLNKNKVYNLEGFNCGLQKPANMMFRTIKTNYT